MARHLPYVLAGAAVAMIAACTEAGNCESDYISSTGEHYCDFIDRADRSPADADEVVEEGVLIDVTGDYLFNVDLGGAGLGDVQLELKVSFTDFRMQDDGTALVDAAFRYPDEGPEATPLATSDDVAIASNGRMALDIGEVRVEPERSPIEDTAVEVAFVLQVTILSLEEMCGSVTDDESNVSSPIPIQLKGVTFAAQRYGDAGQIPTNVPNRCPQGVGGGDDVGVPDAGMDAGFPDIGGDDISIPDGGLVPPDEPLPTGSRADITGRYWMSVGIAGGALSLDFIADTRYVEGGGSAAVDGALRHVKAEGGDTAVATFTTPVTEGGVFDVIVYGLTAESTIGDVLADVALRAVILDEDTWCGVADGAVSQPITVNLAGTTFGAVRVPDDFPPPPYEEPPDFAINACP